MVENEPLLLLATGLPFFAFALSPVLERMRQRLGAVVASVSGITSLTLLLITWAARENAQFVAPWIPTAGVSFTLRLDALSLLFAILITGIGAVILVYSRDYMAHEDTAPRFYAYMSLFMGSMLGLVLAGDLILLFVFWELTTLSSFLLIGLRREEARSIAAALKALLITGLGGLALLVALLLLWYVSDSFDLTVVLGSGQALKASGLLIPALSLMAIAVAAKSAQLPLHIWLPDAMVAPTPVSAYLHSAAMVKAGIYVLARFLPTLASPGWEAVFLPLGTATMVLGGLQALRAYDLKRILAYSTISQLGLIVASLGLPTALGQQAGIFHLLVHAFMKSSLFLVAGVVTLVAGRADIRELGGLGRHMPLTAIACGLAALSLAGIPPLGGFLSKEAYYSVALESGHLWAPILAVLGGALTFAYSLHFFSRIFLGPTTRSGSNKEPLSMAIPALLLASVALVLGLYPAIVTGLVGAIAGTNEVLVPSLLSLHFDTLSMSLLSAIGGLLILWKFGVVATSLERIAKAFGRLTFDGVYQAAITGYRGAARGLGLLVQNGSAHRYTGVLILFILIALIWPLPVPELEFPTLTSVGDVIMATTLVAMVAFAALAASLRQTLHAILSLSGMGFLLAMTFMLLNAPDLAMTQILVEMVVLVIFLIVIYKIPFRAIQPARPRKPVDVALALGTVIGVTTLVALSLSAFLLPSVATYFLETPVELTGGRNVVNVVVTDFRAFDTLGEITVIGLAALAVYTLLRRWGSD